MNRRSFFKFLGAGAAGCAVGKMGKSEVGAEVLLSDYLRGVPLPPAPKITFVTYKDGPLKWEGFKSDMLCGPWEDEAITPNMLGKSLAGLVAATEAVMLKHDIQMWDKYSNTRRT